MALTMHVPFAQMSKTPSATTHYLQRSPYKRKTQNATLQLDESESPPQPPVWIICTAGVTQVPISVSIQMRALKSRQSAAIPFIDCTVPIITAAKCLLQARYANNYTFHGSSCASHSAVCHSYIFHASNNNNKKHVMRACQCWATACRAKLSFREGTQPLPRISEERLRTRQLLLYGDASERGAPGSPLLSELFSCHTLCQSVSYYRPYSAQPSSAEHIFLSFVSI